MNFDEMLLRSFTGGAYLFCGAGFPADCLNLVLDEQLGAGAALLTAINDALAPHSFGPYRDLKNAADRYERVAGVSGLLSLLQDRFKVSHVTEDMAEIMKFPWERIYTTNYDDAIEISCANAGVPYRSFNNLEDFDDIPGSGRPIVHLHGYTLKWTVKNFKQSCVLGANSYLETTRILGDWLHHLQSDYNASTIFVFVGFSASDFHLNEIFFNAFESQPKVFFVNRPAALLDPDVHDTQAKFGRTLGIGRNGLAQILDEVTSRKPPTDPVTPSYSRYIQPRPAHALPSTDSIRDTFLFGRVDRSQVARDIELNKSDYHVLRSATQTILDQLDGEKPIALITGEICDGKSLIIEEVCAILSRSRPVFFLETPYADVVRETLELVSVFNDAVIVIENCFDFVSDRLERLCKLFQGSGAFLILTSRELSARAEVLGIRRLNDLDTINRHRLARLDEIEIRDLLSLSDQIGGWTTKAQTTREKVRFINDQCRASLPGFLLELFRSQNVKDKYTEEFRKTVDLCSSTDLEVVIACLYIAHTGHDPSTSLISTLMRVDAGGLVNRLANTGVGLKLVRTDRGKIKTVPSIGANRILRDIVPTYSKRIVVDTIIKVLASLGSMPNKDDVEQHLFNQLMRYSMLSRVVSEKDEVNRFFDAVSKMDVFRRTVLFWLQWHIAMVDQHRYNDAKTYLDRSDTEADNFDRGGRRKFDRFQIQDRQAKFLMQRGKAEDFRSTLVHDIIEACRIVESLLHRKDVTHHPIETIVLIIDLHDAIASRLDPGLREATRKRIMRLGRFAKTRLSVLEPGTPQQKAKIAYARFRKFKRAQTDEPDPS